MQVPGPRVARKQPRSRTVIAMSSANTFGTFLDTLQRTMGSDKRSAAESGQMAMSVLKILGRGPQTLENLLSMSGLPVKDLQVLLKALGSTGLVVAANGKWRLSEEGKRTLSIAAA